MVNWTNNLWDERAHDGLDRSHIPRQPVWAALGLRIVQFILAFIVLVLTAYAAGKFGTGDLAGFGLSWFTFIVTWAYLIYLGVSLFFTPHIYNYWAQLAVESLLVIFWLCSWAVLASEAADLSPIGDYEYFGYYYSVGEGWKTAVHCLDAAAAMGALLWLTFVITLVFFVLELLKHRKNTAGTTGALGTEPKPVVDGPGATELQTQQPAYPQQTYQQQPVQDSPYETQSYPVEQQQAYAVPQEQAYAVPQQQAPHQQV